MAQAQFTPETLQQVLRRAPQPRRYWVAYSGGMDSHALLHALAALRGGGEDVEDGFPDIKAVHVNHGLSPRARIWSEHCAGVCEALGVELGIHDVNAGPGAGESPEAAARRARYEVLASRVDHGDCLLTAHHQDDQAETLLLQLLRGSGPEGLAGMPFTAAFSLGWLVRPLLEFGREALKAYADAQQLRWVDDETNFDTGYDRNYLRHEIMPRLKQRWPAAARTLSRSAKHNAEAAHLLEHLGVADLVSVTLKQPDVVSVSALRALSPQRRRNVLRAWFKRLELPMPDSAHLDRILNEVLPARRDAEPVVAWTGCAVRRYRDGLYAAVPIPAHDIQACRTWDMRNPLHMPGIGTLHAESAVGRGLAKDRIAGRAITVRFRRGGERCRPRNAGCSHSLKKLFQERGIPPWQRERIPLIYVDDTLAAVVGHWYCEPFGAREDEPGRAVTLESEHG